MDFKIIWTDSAIADLKEICDYISRDNPSLAEKVGRGILDHVKILETFPFIGPAYPRRSSGAVREIVYRKYRFFMKLRTSPGMFMCCASGTGCAKSQSFLDVN